MTISDSLEYRFRSDFVDLHGSRPGLAVDRVDELLEERPKTRLGLSLLGEVDRPVAPTTLGEQREPDHR
jgi:hypothetical protein